MKLEDKWGWKEMPFQREHTILYESVKHKEGLARLRLMVQENYLGLLTGEIGSGKTTLIRYLVQEIDPHFYSPVYISMAGLKPKDFYGELLRHIGEEPPFSLVKAKRLWLERLESRNKQGEKQLLVIVDEAQDLSDNMILELRFVMNHQMDAKSLFPLILVGQPEIRQKIRLKKYEAIQQRINLTYHLSGLTKEETIAYIRHQMKMVDATVPLFSEGAMQLIYGASQGIPRIINQVCVQALFDAASRGHEIIEDNHIQRVLMDHDKQRGGI